MTLNQSAKDSIVHRRELVARLRLRGMTLREIAAALAKQNPPIVNPDTGEAYSDVTIKNDLDALKAEWSKNASVAIDEHQSRQFAELQEIKRDAWSQKNPQLALAALDKEMKLLGTMKQPSGIHITINLEVITRFEQVARDAGVDASKALDEFTQMLQLNAQSAGHSKPSG